MSAKVVVIGIGNDLRRDDGAGPAVIAALAPVVPAGTTLAVADGEPTRLMGLWGTDDHVVIIESLLREAAEPGRIHRFEALWPPAGAAVSSHGVGPLEALRLAEALGRLPRLLVVLAVEGADFAWGEGRSEPVRRALPQLTRLVAEEVERSWARLRAAADRMVDRDDGPAPTDPIPAPPTEEI